VTPYTRRQLVHGVGAVGLALLGGCGRLPFSTQTQTKVPTIGVLVTRGRGRTEDGPLGAFRQGLRDLGYVEGQNVVIEWRFSDVPDEWPSLATELVRLPVDVIVAPSTIGALPAKQATSTIPIVFASVGDPVGLGLVESLARPGGNLTGLSSLTVTLGQKRLEFLKETAPRISRVACLYDSSDPSSVATLSLIIEAARSQAVTVDALGVQAPGDFDRAFEAATRLSADALLTTAGPFLARNAQRIVDFAASTRLPAMYHLRSFVDSGGPMCYAPSVEAQHRRAAYYVDRILKGAKPADLPVEQPREFEFVINLRTAQALGLAIPQHGLLQATEVIQ
jgi:putative tryptophan/tyrosine transport system substrate-binding protein